MGVKLGRLSFGFLNTFAVRAFMPGSEIFTCAEFEMLLARRDVSRTVVKESCVSFFFDRRDRRRFDWGSPSSGADRQVFHADRRGRTDASAT